VKESTCEITSEQPQHTVLPQASLQKSLDSREKFTRSEKKLLDLKF